jgi:hypothetical protein
MTPTLRPDQLQAAAELLAILRTKRLAYLAGEVRTGKTFTVLQVARDLLGNAPGSVLIVTKKKAIASIESDAAAIGVSEMVSVINYEQLHKYAGRSYELLIVDEAHGIGAFPKPSKRFKDLQQISHDYLILMSGTPSPESYSQLYHQIALSRSCHAPWRQYRNFYAWARDYVTVRQKHVGMAMPVNDYSDANRERIMADLGSFVVRMTQAEAGFSQKITEQVHYVPMRRRTYRMAKRIMRDGVIGRPDCRAVLADTGAKVMSKLRQLWSGTVITENHGAIITDDSKARFIASKWHGKKVAILYTFDAERRMLDRVLQRAGITTTDSPEEFNGSGPHCWFRGQVQASREGVNLSAADDLVFLGVDYAALSYLQGRDRASHCNRERENRVHWVLAAGGMERKVFRLVKGKEDFTVAHYRAARGKFSSEIDQVLGGSGVDDGAAAAYQQGRDAGRGAAAPRACNGLRRGEASRRGSQDSTGVSPSRAAKGGV